MSISKRAPPAYRSTLRQERANPALGTTSSKYRQSMRNMVRKGAGGKDRRDGQEPLQEGPLIHANVRSLYPVMDGIGSVLQKIILANMWRIKWRRLGQD